MAEEVGVVNPESKANDIKVGDDCGECAEGRKVKRYAMAERHVEGGTEHRVRENCRHLDASVSGKRRAHLQAPLLKARGSALCGYTSSTRTAMATLTVAP